MAFHGPFRTTQRRRDLAFGKVEQIAENHDVTLAWTQRPQPHHQISAQLDLRVM